MKVAFIPPASLVGTAFKSTYHLVLPQELEKGAEYATGYFNGASKFDFIIMDNGAAEGMPVDFDVLWKHAKDIMADEIVAFDAIGKAQETINLTLQFLDRVAASVTHYEPGVMIVAQGENIDEALHMVRTVLNSPLGWLITSIGVPRHFTKTFDDPFARIRFTMKAHSLFGDSAYRPLAFHFLGANDHTLKEIDWIHREVPFVRGLDSSMPYHYAYYGDTVQAETKRSRPEGYFHLKANLFPEELVEANQDYLLKAAHGNPA